MKHALVVATSNRGKLEELRAMLGDLPLEVYGPADVLPHPFTVVEDGKTFAENAVKKARAMAAATTMLSLGDDSGLEVDALGGRPGVYSARFAHERATDAENNAHLLATLDAIDGGDPSRSVVPRTYPARFRCALALVDPFAADGGAEPIVVHGTCEGKITRTPRGSGGFGYDPLFLVDTTDRTMAELSEHEKNRVSHRSQAFAALLPKLAEVLRARSAQMAAICT